jgi:hypothetical protein
LAPGESTVVELIFRSRTYKTVIKKYATIYSNDPVSPRTKIHLEIEVDAEPDSALYFTMSDNAVSFTENRNKAEIEIVSTSSEDIFLGQITEPVEGLKVEIKNEKIKPGKKGKLRFEWNNPIGKENIEESITFTANDSTIFSIPIFIAGTDPTPTAAEKRKAAAEEKRKENLKESSTGNSENKVQKPGTVRSVRRDAKTGKEIPAISRPGATLKQSKAQQNLTDSKNEQNKEKVVPEEDPAVTKTKPAQEQKDDSGQ